LFAKFRPGRMPPFVPPLFRPAVTDARIGTS